MGVASMTVATGSAAGVAPPTPQGQPFGRDDAATIIFGTGSAPVAGWFATINFGGNYSGSPVDAPTIPRIVTSFFGQWAASVGAYASAPTTSAISIFTLYPPPANMSVANGIGFTWIADM